MEFLLNYVRETVPLWFVLTFTAGIASYWYLTKTHSYWKRLGIPYIKPMPLIGTLGSITSRPLHEIETERYKEKGRIYGTYEGRKPGLTIAEPDILRDILVKDFQSFTNHRSFKTGNPASDKAVNNLEGEEWKRVRSLMTPAFTTRRIKKMTSIFVDSAQTVTTNFKKSAKEGKALDMKRYFGAFSMDVIASTAFGRKIDSHNDPENPFVRAARNIFSRNLTWKTILIFLFPAVLKYFRSTNVGLLNTTFFKEAALKIVEERKRSGEKRNDFLQLMIDATEDRLKEDAGDQNENDKVTDLGHEENSDQVFKQVYSSKTLSNDEVVAQCVLFFIAGFDTTATALSFTAYELALNPDIQDRLIAEIDDVLKEKGELQYEDIYQMKYLDRVISETLRKYPPAVKTERVTTQDYHVKSLNYTIPKGMIVGIPMYAIHHDPEHYPDPEKYDPERFSPEQKATRHPYSYLPFGAGPRNCIAIRFALMEVKVCLVHVLSQCRFSTCSETQVPLEYYIGSGLMQPKQVLLKVEIRNTDTKE